MKKDFLSILDLTRQELDDIFELTDLLKTTNKYRPLEGKAAALIFQKPSMRTRVSFEVGVSQLGGQPIVLSQEAIGIGQRETAADIARMLERFTSLIVARVFDHSILLDLAKYSSVPVVNALTDLSHPCQIVADMYTLRQHNKLVPNFKIAFIGDGNNIVNSWLEMATLYPMYFVLAAPKGYDPDQVILGQALASRTSKIDIVRDPVEAATDADVLYTDVWTSMGQEKEAEARRKAFKGFQITESLLKRAKPGAVVLHCLPAHRGEEITHEVLEGPQSLVFDQGENRLHAQKAILAKLFGATAQQVRTSYTVSTR
jgi:ornithine carbamoyltransferase